MKVVNYLFTIGLLLLSTLIIFAGCKKNNLPTPEFSITYTAITLQDGSSGVQFYADCTSTDVQMTKVDILDPNRTNTVTYNLNNVIHYKGDNFALQDVGIGYVKVGGVYQFTFIGMRLADRSGFATMTKLNVAK